MGSSTAGYHEDATSLSKLLASRSALFSILSASLEAESAISASGDHLSAHYASISTFSNAATPLHSQAIAARAMNARIDRAVAPSLPLLRSFSLVASLQGQASLSPSGDCLLAYVDLVDRLRPRFDAIFDSDASEGIRARHRELQKLLVHAAAKVFYEFALQIEGDGGAAPPPSDGSVPKLVRYSINYLKCLAAEGYAAPMARVLQTKHAWESASVLATSDDGDLLKEALANVLDAVQRHVEAKRSMYNNKNTVTSHIMAMNLYWYVYMRTKGSELAKLVGEDTMKARYKTAAEEAAWAYQEDAWGPLVGLVERGEVEAFMEGVEENLRRHRNEYSVPDKDLREQIKEAVGKTVVAAYAEFLHLHAHERVFLPPDSVQELVSRLFERGGEGRMRSREEKRSWQVRMRGGGRTGDFYET